MENKQTLSRDALGPQPGKEWWYSAILNSLPEPVIVVDNEDRVQLLNPAAENLVGVTSREASGRILEEIIDSYEDPTSPTIEGIDPAVTAASDNSEISSPVLIKGKGSEAAPALINPTIVQDVDGKHLGRALVSYCNHKENSLIGHLMQSRQKYLGLLNGMNDGFVVTDENGIVTFANKALADILGYDRQEEVLGRNFSDLALEEERKLVDALFFTNADPASLPPTLELTLTNPQLGSRRHVELKPSAVELEGRLLGMQAVVRDITDRKISEERLRESLQAKETLLKEIHHRVKNNMQMVTSLLSLQRRQIVDSDTREVFRECETRVKSMALVHELLYESGDLSNIEVAKYARRLTDHLLRGYAAARSAVKIEFKIEAITLGIETAIPCGLIINELVSNSLKHAFPDDRTGKVLIAFERSGESEFRLTISDNGIGLRQTVDYRAGDSLGLKLVNILAEQLGGELELSVEGGTTFSMTFIEKDKGQHGKG